MSDAVSALSALGFSDLEAAVYVALLETPDQTGYAVAQRIGKPTANTYKALESLARKGALLDDGGDPRCYRPVPAGELIERLVAEFTDRAGTATDALERIATEVPDDRVYQLQGDAGQVLARARSMLADARDVVVADLFPGPMGALEESLVEAGKRGVAVFLRGYVPKAPDGPIHYATYDAEPALEAWPGEHLGLVSDACEHLFALFDHGLKNLRQAIWSASPYLSCLAYNNIAMEWRVAAESGRDSGLVPPALVSGEVRGFQRLVKALGGYEVIPSPP